VSEKIHYITTAIDYANGPPHIGHAFEKIGADAMVRYCRLKGKPVHFVMGMDEHGLKVLQTAQAEGMTPKEFADAISAKFAAAWDRLAISNDDFIRTTEPRHRRAVEAMIARMEAAGDIYRGAYEGYYCVGCEAFKREDELVSAPEGAAPGDAEGGTSGSSAPGAVRGGELAGRTVTGLICPIHPSRPLLWTKEENYFFRLSRYQERLLKLLDERPEFVEPESRRNEIRRVLEGGLEDISVSRPRLPWGVPWPGDPDHTVYVWIDALTNYLSAIGFPDETYHRYWPADYHVIGKDITRFHCIYWPAMLMSAGIELPRHVWGHGFVTFAGSKVSKSEGVRLGLDELIDYRGPDALRYFLLREVPWNNDADVSLERFEERYNADLANNVGNLASRALSMIERYREGRVPASPRTVLDEHMAAALLRYRAAMDANLLHQGAAAAIELSAAANVFIEEQAPWKQAKDPAQAAALDATLGSLARGLAALASLLSPFMPVKMRELAERLGLDRVPALDELAELDLAGKTVRRGDVLFPKPQE
jgi:methionyl-tRNA synthetase